MLNTITAPFSEIAKRISHPIAGPFIISWCILNWKFFVFMALSTKNAIDRINYAVEHYLSNICTLLVWPAIISFVYWVAAPFFQRIGELVLTSSQLLFWKTIENIKERILTSSNDRLRNKNEKLQRTEEELNSLIDNKQVELTGIKASITSGADELKKIQEELRDQNVENKNAKGKRALSVAHYFWLNHDLFYALNISSLDAIKHALKQIIWHYCNSGLMDKDASLADELNHLLESTSSDLASFRKNLKEIKTRIEKLVELDIDKQWSGVPGGSIAPRDWSLEDWKQQHKSTKNKDKDS